MRSRCFFIGFTYGFVFSFISSILIALFSNSFAGGSSVSGWSWFFKTTWVPFSVTFGVSGYFLAFKNVGRAKFWLICAIIGFVNVLYMGTIGAIWSSSMINGMTSVNIAGYLTWGPVYAVLSLPLSTVVIGGLLKGLRSIWERRGILA
ncbi:hypothetical protein [Paenibacillus sp. 32352]|uniref:hypothetical protein n=1 Tax=Paenibacillus sp. 32352 TaxID=1969111 RepID=UPI0009ACDA62|nr:hypothetical protein [Paenibacillus sp. 32352]